MKAPKPRRRRWLLWLLALLLLLRLLLAFALPSLLDFGAGFAGLRASLGGSSLSLLGLSLQLENLELRDPAAAADSEPLLRLHDLQVDASLLALLRGDLQIDKVAIGACHLTLATDANGQLLLPTGLTSSGDPTPVPPPPAASADRGPISFALPFWLRQLRVHDLRLQLLSPAGAIAASYTVDLQLDDLGHREQPGRLLLRATSPDQIEAVRLGATLQGTPDRLLADWQLTVAGVDLAPLPPALRELLGEPRRLDLRSHGNGRLERQANGDFDGELRAALLVDLDGERTLSFTAAAGPRPDDRAPLPFALSLQLPLLLDELQLQDGQLDLAAAATRVVADLRLRGLRPGPFQSQLAASGLLLPAAGLSLATNLAAELRHDETAQLSAAVRNLRLGSGELDDPAELLQLQALELDQLQLGEDLDLAALRIRGPELQLRRAADGSLAVAGLRLVPTTASPSPAPASTAAATKPTAPAAATTAAGPAPKLLLREFDWTGCALRFVDDSLPDQPALQLESLQLQGQNLGYGDALPPANLRLAASLPGGDRFAVDLTCRAAPGNTAAELRLTGSELGLAALQPWLTPLGLQPTWQAASLQLDGKLQLLADGDALRPSASLLGLELRDADRRLLSLAALDWQAARLDQEIADFGRLALRGLAVAVDRDALDNYAVAGINLLPAAASPANTSAAAEPAPGPTSAPTPPPTAPATRPWRLGPLQLTDTRLQLRRSEPPLAGDLRLGIELAALQADGQPTPLLLQLQLDEAIRQLEMRGTLAIGDNRSIVELLLAGDGIGGSGFAKLLPDHLQVPLQNGSLRGALSATVDQTSTGTALQLRLGDFALLDGDQELLAIDELAAAVPQLDSDLLHLAKLGLRGLRAELAQTDDGLLLPALLLRPANTAAAEPPAPEPSEAPRRPRRRDRLPALRLDAVQLQLAALRFQDRRGDGGEPLQLTADLRLRESWHSAANLADSPPLLLDFTATAEPCCAGLNLELRLLPFALAPELDANLRLRGINPTALATVLPELREQLGGTTTALELAARLHTVLQLRRRDPLQFALHEAFGAQLHLEELVLRDAVAAQTLCQLDSLDVTARAIDPRSGDVLLRKVELQGLQLGIEQRSEGLAVAGLLLRPAAAPAATSDDQGRATAATSPPPVFAIDRLRVHDLQFDYKDLTTSPVTHLPLQDLDLEINDFSTLALRESLPFRFDLLLRGGDVELDRRIARSSVLTGVLGSAASALVGSRNRHRKELRPLFQDLRLHGDLQVFPQPRGEVELELNGLELPAFRGLAAGGGVAINDGLLDARARAQWQGAQGGMLRAGLVFTSLSLTEPPNGPITTYLRLPAPLDTVLFLLRNDANEQRLPLQAALPADGLATGPLVEAAVEALALAIGNAVARSPFRLASTVTSIFDFWRRRDPREAIVGNAGFAAGGSAPELQGLAELLAATRKDPEQRYLLVHEFGAGDLARIEALANPPREVIAAGIERLRSERRQLLAERQQLAARTTVQIATAQPDATSSLQELQQLDRQLGELEATLDAAIDQLEDDTPRARSRRNRAAAEAFASLRLANLRRELLQRLPPGSDDRIELRRPRPGTSEELDAGGRIVVTARRRSQGNPNLDRDPDSMQNAPTSADVEALLPPGFREQPSLQFRRF